MVEVGSLAQSLGAQKRFEVRTRGHLSRIDLIVTTDWLQMPIEACILFNDIRFRTVQADLDRLTEAWLRLQVTRKLNIDLVIDLV
jgi:hypothetical protein